MLKLYRKRKGITQEQLADLVGATHPTIQRLENGKISFTLEWAQRLAPHLGVEPVNLMFDEAAIRAAEKAAHLVEEDHLFELVPIIGKVEAGAWNGHEEVEIWEAEKVSLPVDPRFTRNERRALRVCGNSMNLLFPENSLVVCVDLHDLDEPPVNGGIYVVRRTSPAGEVETTLKELRIEPDGRMYLWPRSSDPEHQTPIFFDGNPDGVEISLRAKVVASYTLL